MNLQEEIESKDMNEVIDRMNAYAISRLKFVGVKNFNGIEPIDFVGNVLLKVAEGKRDWAKAKCSFIDFLFGCLKSEINNFFTSNKNIYDDLPDIPSNEQFLNVENETLNVENEKKQVSELLKQEGADDDELLVFQYWMDGTMKPAEIAKDLGIDVKKIYKIIKRIERKLPKIQKQVTNII